MAARVAIEDKVDGGEILKNTTLAYYKPDLTFAPYPLETKFVMDNKKLYSKYDFQDDEYKTMRSIINDYTKNKLRIGINVEILDNVMPPNYIMKDLLSNYQNQSSDSDSDSDIAEK